MKEGRVSMVGLAIGPPGLVGVERGSFLYGTAVLAVISWVGLLR
jgi:hypothetical protein